MFLIRERECGNEITAVETLSEAKFLVNEYEKEDKLDDCYSENFYEIVEVETDYDIIEAFQER